jgi:hypothetical protein
MLGIDTVALSDGTATHIYSLVKLYENEIKSVRREAAAGFNNPKLLTISHQESGSGLTAKVSSLVRFDRVVEDASGNQGTIEVYRVTRYSRNIATSAQVRELQVELNSFDAAAGYSDKQLNLEP